MTQQKNLLQSKQKKIRRPGRIGAGLKFVPVLLITVLSLALCSCSEKKQRPLIIWTNIPDFASYSEVFNSCHTEEKVVVLYKENPIKALPPGKDEIKPDIVVGPWLKNFQTRKYFSKLDSLFVKKKLSADVFYSEMLNFGKIQKKQYLIPVSFNLPAMILNEKNEGLLENLHYIDIADVKNYASAFNRKSGEEFEAIGYAPSWDSHFTYLYSMLNGANFTGRGSNFVYNEESVSDTIRILSEWTQEYNGSSSVEEDFKFKYLYMNENRQVTTGRCLFAQMDSNDYFVLSDEQLNGLTYRWIENDGVLPIDDSIVSMGVYSKSKLKKAAMNFLAWFSDEETQKQLLEHKAKTNVDTVSFGIADGFSALKKVNDSVYPIYYRSLLNNIPDCENILLPNILPYNWDTLKKRVIIPYLQDASSTANPAGDKNLYDYLEEYNRVLF